MNISLETNAPYPNRIQLILGDQITGPLVGSTRAFNPSVDVTVYIDGIAVALANWSFDSANNRYLLYTYAIFDPTSIVQAVYHMSTPLFFGSYIMGYGDGGYGDPGYGDILATTPPPLLGGFSLVASYSTSGDTTPTIVTSVPGSATLTVSVYPTSPPYDTPFLVIFSSSITTYVQASIPAAGSYGGHTSGMVSATASAVGVIGIPGAPIGSYQVTLAAYNADATPVLQGGTQLTATIPVDIV
jgi:hypothetical protein